MLMTPNMSKQVTELAVVMFGAAPGGYKEYLNNVYADNNADQAATAAAYSNEPAFADLHQAEAADTVINNLALDAVEDVDTQNFAKNYIQEQVDAGADLASLYVTALDYMKQNEEDFAGALNVIDAKITAADNFTNGLGAQVTNFNVLQGVVADYQGSPSAIFDTLTGNNDVIYGNDSDNLFMAGLTSESNTLNSDDYINGLGGTDTLEATISTTPFAISPETSSVEVLKVRSQADGADQGNNDPELVDGISNSGRNVNTIDAQDMDGTHQFWSLDSRADLKIEDIQSASHMTTVGIDSADAGDVDYETYFDNITAPTAQTNLGDKYVTLELMDLENADLSVNGMPVSVNPNPLEKNVYNQFKLNIDDREVVIDVNNEDGEAVTTNYTDLVDAINADLAEKGLDQVVTAELGNPIEKSDAEGTLRTAPEVNLIYSGEGNFTAENWEISGTSEDTETGYHTSAKNDADAPVTTAYDTQVNVLLEDAGQGSRTGDFLAGNMSTGVSSDSQGIEQFNVTVDGSKADGEGLSWLNSMMTTNESMNSVYIRSAEGSDSDLRIDRLQDGLSTVAAGKAAPGAEDGLAAFNGDLTLGADSRDSDNAVNDLDTLDANIDGQVTYYGDGTNTIITGSGNDIVNEINAAADINTNGGNDEVTADVVGTTSINTGSGNDQVMLTQGEGTAQVNVELGSGNDTLHSNDETITVDSGTGNDAMYLENTGSMGTTNTMFSQLANDFGENTDGQEDNADTGFHLLYGRTVTVVVNGDQGVNNNAANEFTDGFESEAVTIKAADGYNYLTTQAEFDAAVEQAIADSPVLSKLVEYNNGEFTSLVDGDQNSVKVLVSESDWSDQQKASLQSEYQDYVDYSEATISDQAAYTAEGTMAGTDSNDSTDNTVIMAQGSDVVQLSTAATADDEANTSNDTLVFTLNDFGTTYVNNFDSNDALNFTAFLTDEYSNSGSDVSKETMDITYGTNTTLDANEVTVLNGDGLTSLDDGYFDDIDQGNLTDTIDFTYTTYTNADDNKELVDGVSNSVVMVENADNEGEYKVFYIETDNVADDVDDNADPSVDFKGIVDFGASLDLSESNFVNSATFAQDFGSTTEDGNDDKNPGGGGTIPVNKDVTGKDGVAEIFEYNIDSSTGEAVSLAGGDFTITNFNTDEDSIVFNDVNAGTLTTETFGDTTPTVSESGINNKTDIVFANDADGDAYQLTLAGIVDQNLDTVNFEVA